VKITVEPKYLSQFTINVRIPGWARNRPVPSDLYRYLSKNEEKVTLKVNDKNILLHVVKGFARVRRTWRKGDKIELHLPMPVRRVLCHEKVQENVGKVALERGPIVYCAEWVDNAGRVLDFVLPDDVALRPEYRKDMLDGITVIRGEIPLVVGGGERQAGAKERQGFVAIPYYAWAHRGAGEMAVWLKRDAKKSQLARPSTFFVAPDGNDSWSGRLPKPNEDGTDGPFGTVHAACEAARKQGTKKTRKVVIQSGRYFLNRPLVLKGEDSGLTVEAAPGAKVCLYGGRRVTGWEKDGKSFYSVKLPGVKDRKWDFRCLFVNGRFCPRARLPEEGSFTHLSTFDVPWMSSTGGGWKRKPTGRELTSMKYRPEDLGPWLDISNAEITVYHMWDESLVGVSSMDTDSHTLTFASKSGHPPGAFGVKKYVVWNIREGMTKPGQWYLDRTAEKLSYWPLSGEDMSKAEVLVPALDSIIRIRGEKGNPAKNITIKGITFSVTTTPLEAGGFGAGRFDGAVSAALAENCRLVDLEVFNVGGQGIKASGAELRIEGCHVHHTGACGIMFAGAGTVVSDNHIHDVGLTYPSAIGLRGGGKNVLLSHNAIHDTPYTAINCGGENTRIEHNLIYRAMLELHDGGGIYCFAGKNLVLRGNFIRDIPDTGGYGSSAYYLDERSENCLVEENLSLRVARPSHNHMAKNNTIRNNVFVVSEDARLTFPKSSGYTVENNVIYAKGGITITNPDAIKTLQNNILFSANGKVECRRLRDYRQTDSHALEPGDGNLLADPLLAEFEKGKVSFVPRSPAAKLGITPIDVSTAGPR
jgi:hypothetical protein